MIEPQNIKREDFPKSEAVSEGMIPLTVCCDNLELIYHENVEYIKRNGKSLYLQIISPIEPSGKKLPLVVYIPGSAFHKQNVPRVSSQLSLLANRGFVVAMVEYRPSEEAPFPAQALDAKAALRFMQKNAASYGADSEKIVVMGDSSGGHTALMAGLTTGISSLEETDHPVSVKGVVDYYGPVNIATMNDVLSSQNHIEKDSPEGYLIGQKNVLENPELVFPTVITNYITKERPLPPVLIVHGSNDELVPFAQSCELNDALKKAEKDVTFYQLLSAHHGGREFWCNEVLDITEQFIQRCCR